MKNGSLMFIVVPLFFLGVPAYGANEVPLAESPIPKVCGMIGASFDDSDNLSYKSPPDFMDYDYEIELEITKRITWEPRLLTPLASLGMHGVNGWHNPQDRIRYVSTAFGGAQTYHYMGQLRALDNRVYLKGLDCLIVGMSGSFFWRPEESINDLWEIYNWARNTLPDMKVIFIEYPEIQAGVNVSWEFYSIGIDWDYYHTISRPMFRNVFCSQINASCVNAWYGFQGGRDGWHPNWDSVIVAAERMDQEIRYQIGMEAIQY